MSDSLLNQFVASGTTAERNAFTPSPPTPASGPDPGYLWWDTDLQAEYAWDAGGAAWVATGGGGGTPGGSNTQVQYNNSGSFGGITGATTNGTALTLVAPVLGTPASGTLTNCTGLPATTGLITVPGNICEGRLTTESGVPVSTSDRTAQGTLYWTPCTPTGVAIGTGQITLYNGTNLVTKAITELSLVLTLTSGKNYDVFVDYNAGTPQLVLSAAWTTDTARADALATQAGIVVKSGTTAYRWVGTIRASGANVTADSGGIAGTTMVGGQRFVWNAYNQVPRQNNVKDTTDTWAYNTATIRQANATAGAGNKVEYITGDASSYIDARVIGNVSQSSATSQASVGVGVDTITAYSGLVGAGYVGGTGAVNHCILGIYSGQPGLGYHYVAWNEKGGGGTCTFSGDNGGDGSQSGLSVWMLA